MTERLAQILADSFFKILIPGITVTIPLTALSFSISLVISVAVALVQFAQVPVLTKLARLYIWIIRGTPILVQLFVVFYGLPGVGILIEPFPAAVLVFPSTRVLTVPRLSARRWNRCPRASWKQGSAWA